MTGAAEMVLREGIGYVDPAASFDDQTLAPADAAAWQHTLDREWYARREIDARESAMAQVALWCYLRAGAPGHWRTPAAGTPSAAARAAVAKLVGAEPPLRALVGGCRVWTYGDGTWMPYPTDWLPFEAPRAGIPVLTVPVFLGETLVDLLAIDATEPEQFWTFTGAPGVDVLGFDPWSPAFQAWEAGEAVRLARTPFAWLRGGQAAACVLDPDSLHGRALLLEAKVVCDDEVHAAAIVDRRETHLRDLRRQVLPKQAGAFATVMVAGDG